MVRNDVITQYIMRVPPPKTIFATVSVTKSPARTQKHTSSPISMGSGVFTNFEGLKPLRSPHLTCTRTTLTPVPMGFFIVREVAIFIHSATSYHDHLLPHRGNRQVQLDTHAV